MDAIGRRPFVTVIYNWSRIILVTGFAQALIQLLGLVSGILVIRQLKMTEYALYTIANTMLGAMNILSNGGITAGVMAEGGKVWRDKEKLGTVIITGLDLRKKFAIFSFIISAIILFYLLLRNNCSVYMAVVIVVSLLPAFYAGLSSSMLEVAPKLNQDITPLQKNQMMVSAGRLLLLGSSIIFLPFTFIALLSDGIPRLIGNIRLKKISDKFVELSQGVDKGIQSVILGIVRRVLPGDIYNIFSVQITVWILSLFGSTTAIAQVGALFRIAAVLTVFNVCFTTIVVPRYSRLVNDKHLLLKKITQIIAVLILVSFSIVLMVWLFSSQIIWLMGSSYAGLNRELVLVIIIFCLNFMSNIIYALCTSRGSVINPLLLIGVNLASIVIGVLLFNIASIKGVLLYNIFVSAIMVLMHSIYSFISVSKMDSATLNVK